MTPCEERGLKEGQWVWAHNWCGNAIGGGHMEIPGWVMLSLDDGSIAPKFSQGAKQTYITLPERIDFTQGIHNEKPNWTPKEYGGEGPPTECNGEGLPPVGTVCECSQEIFDDEPEFVWRPGDRLEILAHRQSASGRPLAVAWNMRACTALALVAGCFRPIRTERERVIDDAHDVVIKVIGEQYGSVAEILDAAYDAGFLRNPKESDNG